jgi:hypothetical protein
LYYLFVASFHTIKKSTLYYFNILKLTETSTQEAETGKPKVQSSLGYIVSPRFRSYIEKKELLRLVWELIIGVFWRILTYT